MGPIYQGLVRHALTVAGTALGLGAAGDGLEQAAGAVVTLLMFAWSIWSKRHAAAA